MHLIDVMRLRKVQILKYKMKTLLYILVISTLLFGCKKYPEDKTLIHFRRPEHRLKKSNEWKITEYKINDVDSIPYVNNFLHPGFKLQDINF